MNSPIDPELARSFEDASATLIGRIRQAIRTFTQRHPRLGAWELWRTPKPWETRVLSNLERYHRHLKAAVTAYDTGDIKPITDEASATQVFRKTSISTRDG